MHFLSFLLFFFTATQSASRITPIKILESDFNRMRESQTEGFQWRNSEGFVFTMKAKGTVSVTCEPQPEDLSAPKPKLCLMSLNRYHIEKGYESIQHAKKQRKTIEPFKLLSCDDKACTISLPISDGVVPLSLPPA